ncbi:hypothetical protein Tco_0716374, partial [Tanacetum coccineum]
DNGGGVMVASVVVLVMAMMVT